MEPTERVMELITTPAEMRARARECHRAGQRIGLVPTMGNLHEGHLSLMRRAAAETDVAVASLFVNPLQFGAGEDLGSYPRTFDEDIAAAEKAGIAAMFAPTDDAMYPPGFATSVEVSGLTDRLCGAARPGHFRGVTTVVMKLFCLVQPDRAYFGEKDYQQMVVVRRMAADLDTGVELVPMPIIREPDGLAMSSRNRYLGPEDRAAAASLHRALQAADDVARQGATATETICAAARIVMAREPRVAVEYVELIEPETLEPLAVLDRPGRLLVAARVGPARLIDNLLLKPAPENVTPLGLLA